MDSFLSLIISENAFGFKQPLQYKDLPFPCSRKLYKSTLTRQSLLDHPELRRTYVT